MTSTKQKTFVSLAVGEVVKQGYLFVKRPPRKYWDKLKAWHKRYFVLKDESEGPVLEMYDSHSALTMPVCKPQLALDLNQAVHIGITEDSTRFQFSIVVVCHGRTPLVLAADDELGARSWLLALGLVAHKGSSSDHHWTATCLKRKSDKARGSGSSGRCSMGSQLQDLSNDAEDELDESVFFADFVETGIDASFLREKFKVVVHPTQSSEKVGLRGEVDLATFSHGVGVIRPGESECSLVWPVAFIRQYRHETLGSGGRSRTTLVTLEVGRRCSTGEGVFQFRTRQGTEIIRELKRIVSTWSAKRHATSVLRQARYDKRLGSQRPSWHRAGRSEPSTPLKSISHSNHKRQSSTTSCSTANNEQSEADINYIVPMFDNSPDSGDEKSSALKNPKRHLVPAKCYILHDTEKGEQSSPKKTEEEQAYIEVLPT